MVCQVTSGQSADSVLQWNAGARINGNLLASGWIGDGAWVVIEGGVHGEDGLAVPSFLPIIV